MEHDDEIHAATLHVHEWFHQQVLLSFYDDPERAEQEADAVLAS